MERKRRRLRKKADCGSSKKPATSEPSDRISNLPREVLAEILQRMPIREAMKTSILSRGWRHQWTEMSQLVFSPNTYPPNYDKLHKHEELVDFVNSILQRHNGTITYFELNDFINSCPEIDQWILDLSKKTVRHLILVFNKVKRYEVPATIFACESLTTLTLERCILGSVPSEFEGFNSLTALHLSYVRLTNEVLDGLLVKLPVLDKLTLRYCETLTHFSFTAATPNLKAFCFSGGCKSIKLQNASSLSYIKVRQWPTSHTSLECRVDDILGGLCKLQAIHIAHPFIEFSSMETAPERFETTFQYLTDMNLSVNFEDPKQIMALLCLCRSSPQLRTLIIMDVQDTEPVLSYDETFWNAQLQKQEAFKSLKSVELSEFKGSRHQMRFTSFILFKALALESFSISWLKGDTLNSEDKVRTIDKVMQFQKTSTKARVISLSSRKTPCILLF